MTTDEHEALSKAARQGEQNRYIIKALRAQLRRDGHMSTDDKQPSLPLVRNQKNGARRAAKKR